MNTVFNVPADIPEGFRFTKENGPVYFVCDRCNETKPVNLGGSSTGYATDYEGTKFTCFDCCGEVDVEYMLEHGRNTMYLTKKETGYFVTNWPATLNIAIPYAPRKGRHNFAGTRYDVWFSFKGSDWHGVQYGENTSICHVRKVKS